MKNLFKITMLLFGFSILASCSKTEYDFLETDEINEELSKIETIFHEGDTKIENLFKSGDIKIETFANELTKEKIRLELENNISKKITSLTQLKALPLMDPLGVIKNGSCGKYSTLTINMDDEDKRNSTSSSGWIGNCFASGNTRLEICMVYGSAISFGGIGQDYAILDLNGIARQSTDSWFVRHFDNEDSGNANSVYINGVRQASNYTIGKCTFNSNTTLNFLIIRADEIATGISVDIPSFGVFGKIPYKQQGWIHTDDEDSGNSNYLWSHIYNRISGTYTQGYVSSVPSIVDGGVNTILYMSKIK